MLLLCVATSICAGFLFLGSEPKKNFGISISLHHLPARIAWTLQQFWGLTRAPCLEFLLVASMQLPDANRLKFHDLSLLKWFEGSWRNLELMGQRSNKIFCLLLPRRSFRTLQICTWTGLLLAAWMSIPCFKKMRSVRCWRQKAFSGQKSAFFCRIVHNVLN